MRKIKFLVVVLSVIMFLTGCSTDHSLNTNTNKTIEESAKEKQLKIKFKYKQGKTLSLNKMSTEELYKIFGDDIEERITFFSTNYNENDKFVILEDYTMLNGEAIMGLKKVNSNTDTNSFTLKQLKEILLMHKEKIENFNK
ncbi:hypothetical protein [Enterococcus sp. DIV0086]|uniref:hypothetical protein n=1 Tax=Enterococcus sp. DIV0086 TaxID=2774655 RepID=UPI003D27FFAC